MLPFYEKYTLSEQTKLFKRNLSISNFLMENLPWFVVYCCGQNQRGKLRKWFQDKLLWNFEKEYQFFVSFVNIFLYSHGTMNTNNVYTTHICPGTTEHTVTRAPIPGVQTVNYIK